MLHNGINLDRRWRGKQPRHAMRATGVMVMALGVVGMALAFIRVRVAAGLLTNRHIMARLTGHVLRSPHTMARQTLGQGRNTRPQRQTQHQHNVDKETGLHCC